jgi:hypothetical protein
VPPCPAIERETISEALTAPNPTLNTTEQRPAPTEARETARLVFSMVIMKHPINSITASDVRIHVPRRLSSSINTPNEQGILNHLEPILLPPDEETPGRQLIVVPTVILDGTEDAITREIVTRLVDIIRAYKRLHPNF